MKNGVSVRYFAKFPPTRTKIFSDRGLDASDGGCSPPLAPPPEQNNVIDFVSSNKDSTF